MSEGSTDEGDAPAPRGACRSDPPRAAAARGPRVLGVSSDSEVVVKFFIVELSGVCGVVVKRSMSTGTTAAFSSAIAAMISRYVASIPLISRTASSASANVADVTASLTDFTGTDNNQPEAFVLCRTGARRITQTRHSGCFTSSARAKPARR